MRAKGKWEKPKTLASEAKARELHGSIRIFNNEDDIPSSPAAQPVEKKVSKKRHPKERRAIKHKLLHVMKEIESERNMAKELNKEYETLVKEAYETLQQRYGQPAEQEA